MNIIESLHNMLSSVYRLPLSVIKKYPIETVLIIAASVVTLLSWRQSVVIAADQDKTISLPTQAPVTDQSSPAPPIHVKVDVSGAVYEPGVYEATAGARIADLIEMAGGISYEADQYFVARNFNMARMVGDQDKIYIPYTWDIALGTFTEEKRILEYLNPLYPGETATSFEAKKTTQPETASSDLQLSINTATKDELDMLPGVGPVTAQKIIDSRPYVSLDELTIKKVLSTTAFENLKDFISL